MMADEMIAFVFQDKINELEKIQSEIEKINNENKNLENILISKGFSIEHIEAIKQEAISSTRI